jgi:sec-independent protein translocase protein TatA
LVISGNILSEDIMFSSQFGFLNLGTPELLLILLIILLLFGGRKLPELARSAGSSVRELRKGLNEGNGKNQKQADEKKKQSKSGS